MIINYWLSNEANIQQLIFPVGPSGLLKIRIEKAVSIILENMNHGKILKLGILNKSVSE